MLKTTLSLDIGIKGVKRSYPSELRGYVSMLLDVGVFIWGVDCIPRLDTGILLALCL